MEKEAGIVTLPTNDERILFLLLSVAVEANTGTDIISWCTNTMICHLAVMRKTEQEAE